MSSTFTRFRKHVIKFCMHAINGSLHVPKFYIDVPVNIYLLLSKLSRFKKSADTENIQLKLYQISNCRSYAYLKKYISIR
jgi:hypothetical protein